MSIIGLSDTEIVELIIETIDEGEAINREYLEIDCQGSKPILAGRVASDEELETLNEILTDILDIDDYENNVWVDDSLAFEEGAEDAESQSSRDLLESDEDEDLDDEADFEEEEDDL